MVREKRGRPAATIPSEKHHTPQTLTLLRQEHRTVENLLYREVLAKGSTLKKILGDLETKHAKCEGLLNEFARTLVNVLLEV